MVELHWSLGTPCSAEAALEKLLERADAGCRRMDVGWSRMEAGARWQGTVSGSSMQQPLTRWRAVARRRTAGCPGLAQAAGARCAELLPSTALHSAAAVHGVSPGGPTVVPALKIDRLSRKGRDRCEMTAVGRVDTTGIRVPHLYF